MVAKQEVTDQGLTYVVGITSAVVVWPPECSPCRLNLTVARVGRQ